MTQSYARIVDGIVFEIISLPDGQSPQTNYVAEIALQFVPCPTNVRQNWTYDGTNFSPPAPAPPSQPSMIVDYLQFRALFTAAEDQAIMAAARSNGAVLDWLLQAAGAGQIDLTNPQVKQGLDALVVAGLITATRETQILANQAPPTS